MKHYPTSVRLARSILRHDAEADDAVQAAYGNAVKHIGNFREESSFGTWISRIVVNQCLMRLRQLKRTPLTSLDDMVVEPRTEMPWNVPSPRPDEVLERKQTAEAIQSAIHELPETLRGAWTLYEMDGLSLIDLSKELGISVAAAKSRLFRARLELRRMLSGLMWNGGELAGAS